MKHILFFAAFLVSLTAIAQVTNEVEPRSWSIVEKSTFKTDPIILPSVNEENSTKD